MSMGKAPVSEQRIAFETWYKANDTSANLVRTGKGYIDNTTRVAWRAWQAAPAAPLQEPVVLRPEDVTVEVLILQSSGGFAPLKTHGVKLTHKPTGIVVQCSSERSQHRNREQAWRDLERYLYGARPQPAAQPPRFPTMLRKMWSGTEVQEWIDANWKGGA